jgi:16S rRNA (adenine1518-N6/adenine1519-N6)-dimethyltransferase
MSNHQQVKAKKHLGQHFLTSEQIASDIAQAHLRLFQQGKVLEIGPGMGMLTKYLLMDDIDLYASEVDKDSIQYLNKAYPQLEGKVLFEDFLNMDLSAFANGQSFSVIGNFPYNISSQLVFKVIDNKQYIPLLTGMFQKEVAERIASKPGSKEYGIISVFTQLFYEVNYLFTVPEHVFNPPPKVKSGVINMIRRASVPEVDYFMLRNAIAIFGVNDVNLQASGYADKRAEELSVDDFIQLTKLVITHGNQNH